MQNLVLLALLMLCSCLRNLLPAARDVVRAMVLLQNNQGSVQHLREPCQLLGCSLNTSQ